MEISRNILLTGAGFTRNFGGFLADGMWSHIFNHPQIQNRQTIRDVLLRDFNYESIYNRILKGPADKFNDSEKEAIRVAVDGAYKRLDHSIINYLSPPHEITLGNYLYATNRFLDRFSGERNTISFFFTLNQDILIERFYESSQKPFVLLNVQRVPATGDSEKQRHNLEGADYITLNPSSKLSNKPANDLSPNEFHYIKLHGSLNWRSSDGSNLMVIGEDKEQIIKSEPLLTNYFEIFKGVLCENERRLLIIGYGFRDKHINEIIATAVKEHGLKLYVVSPEPPESFINKLYCMDDKDTYPFGYQILEGLSGYFPQKLPELLDGNRFKILDNDYFCLT